MGRSRAVGGPRHNIILEAPIRWDGHIGGDLTGHYEWRYEQWVWVEMSRPRSVRSYKTPRRKSNA